jgi:hypothetical protein
MVSVLRGSIPTLVLLIFATTAIPARAAEWYVAPNGRAEGTGQASAPWDIASALGGEHKVAPGDTVWLLEGTYKVPVKSGSRGFPVHLAGAANAPIHVRAQAGKRVTIDGGLLIEKPATHLWIWDLEITVSEPLTIGTKAKPAPKGSWPNLNRPNGGLNVDTGTGCKYINLVLHHNSGGAGFWEGAKDSEMHGCLIYDNGWIGVDRGHGHAIYTQNNDGTKIISDCIMAGGQGYTMHCYTEKGHVNNFVFEGNIAYDNPYHFLVGAGQGAHGIVVKNNYVFNAGDLLVKANQDCQVRDNIVVNGELMIKNSKTVTQAGNRTLPKDAPRPEGATVIVRLNKYAPQRANLAIFNWEKKAEVDVDTGVFLGKGDRYRLLNPRDFYGKPLASGTADGKTLRVPVAGEFAAFVLIKEPAP